MAVIGAGDDAPRRGLQARVRDRAAKSRGAAPCLLNGGRTGVMESAAAGARKEGGHTIGILPGYDRRAANRHVEFVIATGIGEARNAVIVASADAVIALAGEGGTLAEIGFAKKFGKPIVALDSWPEIEGLNRADTPADAVALALKLAASNSRRRN